MDNHDQGLAEMLGPGEGIEDDVGSRPVTDGIGGFNGGLDTIDSRRQGSR
jgi:hypothetical protein